MTIKERQMFYWIGEANSALKCRDMQPKGTNEWKFWNDRYKRALETYKEICGGRA